MTDLKNLDLKLYGEIPKDILDAANKIEMWAKQNGWLGWCINGISDRALVEDLHCRLKKIREIIEPQP